MKGFSIMQKIFLVMILILSLLFIAGCQKTILNMSGFYIPAMGIDEDEDASEPGGGVEFDANLNTGHGYAIRAIFENNHDLDDKSPTEMITGFGMLYINSTHQDQWYDSDVITHSGYLDLYCKKPISEKLFMETDFGVGGAVFDFTENVYDDTGGGALLLRLGFGIAASKTVDLHVGAGGFMWGWPGETVGHGGFITTGASVRF